MEEDYSELAQKCINFSNQFRYSSHFSFSVNFDTFSFTVTHRKSRKSDEETQGRQKYVSPSNRRRNQRRLKAFLKKKAQHCGITPSSEEDAKLDTSQSSSSGSTTSPEEVKLDTSQPSSSPSTTSNTVSHNVSNTVPNTTQLSPRTAILDMFWRHPLLIINLYKDFLDIFLKHPLLIINFTGILRLFFKDTPYFTI